MIIHKSFLKDKGFIDLDFYFAESISENENEILFLAFVFFFSRQGHICCHFSEEMDKPSIEFLDCQMQNIKKLILEGLRSFIERPIEKQYPITIHKDFIYLEKNFFYETNLLVHFKRLINQHPCLWTPAESPNHLSKEQKEAIDKVCRHQVTMISGGPGTGKTFTASQIIKSFIHSFDKPLELVLAAPTGKAVSRLEESIRKEIDISYPLRVGTVHSILKLSSYQQSFTDTFALVADLIIIDECSMLDAELFAYLLNCIRGQTRLILMGDPCQLGAVENGSFFYDLINIFPQYTITLNKNFRSEQHLTHLIKSILEGQLEPHLSDFFLKKLCLDSLMKEILELLPKKEKVSPNIKQNLDFFENFKILSCVRKGIFGSDQLNQKIVDLLISQAEPEEWLSIPIIIKKNDYSRNLYNGQTGIWVTKKKNGLLKGEENKQEDIIYLSDHRQLSLKDIPYFDYAYCLSVHKSQGSEYKKVMLLIPDEAEVFGKEIIYTGVTRAKKEVTIFGNIDTIREMLKRNSIRVSNLKQRFLEE
ncbi:MAG: exodeoxyribonuclease V subunit alpha [Rhabdochlamydiaceae bacterium]